MYTKETAKTYVGTKRLMAWPMSRAEYNTYRGWTLPPDERGEDTGYLVEYLDQAGNQANHPNHEGYVSWSPANVFEHSYHEEPTDWRMRLVYEVADLGGRLGLLRDFMKTPTFMALPAMDRELLNEQEMAMDSLLDILRERLDRAYPPEKTEDGGEPEPEESEDDHEAERARLQD